VLFSSVYTCNYTTDNEILACTVYWSKTINRKNTQCKHRHISHAKFIPPVINSLQHNIRHLIKMSDNNRRQTRISIVKIVQFFVDVKFTCDILGASVFQTAVRWRKLGEVEIEYTLHNSIVLAMYVPKIIKVGWNLTKLWWKQFWLFFETRCTFAKQIYPSRKVT